MRAGLYTSFGIVGLSLGIVAASFLSVDGLSSSEPSYLRLSCGDRWFATDLSIDTARGEGHLEFSGALVPKRSYTEARLVSYVPNDVMILRFKDGFGGRLRLFRPDERQAHWHAVVIEANNLAPRDLGRCRGRA